MTRDVQSKTEQGMLPLCCPGRPVDVASQLEPLGAGRRLSMVRGHQPDQDLATL